VAHNLVLEVLAQLGLVGLIGIFGFIFACLWSAWRARNGELGGEARAVLASLIGYLVCQMFSGYSTSWFLFALCGFATCCDAWGARRAKETV
jgi:O-antigen ligase